MRNFSLQVKYLIAPLIIGILTLVGDAYYRGLPYEWQEEQIAAADLMTLCEKEIFSFVQKEGLHFNPIDDPNYTGLIGPEFVEFTTTVGNIAAKRTSTNPAFAAAMVRYFKEIGLKAGDVVAIGASGSFPGLLLATLSATKVLNLQPVIIYSLGASSYGAGAYNFTAMEMLDFWREKNLLPYSTLAFSMGGGSDLADDLIFPEYQEYFLKKGSEYPALFIHEKDVIVSEKVRQNMYDEFAQNLGKEIACFVNVGGASVNAGTASSLVSLNNGIVLPPKNIKSISPSEPGLVFYYLRKNVPIIHLLNIRDLALKNGIPIDVTPFPKLGVGRVYENDVNLFVRTLLLGLSALLIIILCILGCKRRKA